MKKVLLFFLIVSSFSLGQNLVPNPSFEDTISCPNGGSQISNALGWSSFRASPDYFNSCSSPNFFSVPDNFFNYQAAASGNAYTGIITYTRDTNQVERREIIGRNLMQPLIIGQRYFVSLKANLVLNSALWTNLASNKLGVLFTTSAFSNVDSDSEIPINNFAHIYSDEIISDTANWTTISGSFVADSTYGFISIGNFFYSLNTDTIQHINDTTFIPSAYYFIDDICVSTDSLTCNSYVGLKDIIKNYNVLIYPNPTSDFVNLKFNDYENHTIVIYNSIGEIILTESITQQSSIDLSTLPQGIYQIQTNINNDVINEKLIIINP